MATLLIIIGKFLGGCAAWLAALATAAQAFFGFDEYQSRHQPQSAPDAAQAAPTPPPDPGVAGPPAAAPETPGGDPAAGASPTVPPAESRPSRPAEYRTWSSFRYGDMDVIEVARPANAPHVLKVRLRLQAHAPLHVGPSSEAEPITAENADNTCTTVDRILVATSNGRARELGRDEFVPVGAGDAAEITATLHCGMPISVQDTVAIVSRLGVIVSTGAGRVLAVETFTSDGGPISAGG